MRLHVLLAQHLVHARDQAVGGVGDVLQRGGLGRDHRDLVAIDVGQRAARSGCRR